MTIMKFKLAFFDRKAVIDAVDKAKRRVLSYAGNYLKKVAQNSIKSAGNNNESSKPGEPPRYHTRLLKKFLFAAYDKNTQSAVVGPAKINRSSGAPEILEKGGVTKVVSRGKSRKVKILPRPYMSPALEKTIPKLPPMWRGSVRGP